jgi:hypothetical protein
MTIAMSANEHNIWDATLFNVPGFKGHPFAKDISREFRRSILIVD